MFKKSLFLVVVLLIAVSVFPLGASAADEPDIIVTPMYTLIGYTIQDLEINSSGYCQMFATVEGLPSVDSTAISSYLQKYVNGSWTNVNSYYASDDDYTCNWAKNIYVAHGTYRLKCVFYCYDGGSYESTTKYTGSRTY